MNVKINKIGFRFGILAFASNVAFVLVQTLQLLRILKYPFDEIFIKIAPENPVLWTGMKGASVENRKNVVYETR